MRALTILQPYATLLAIGAKRYETRSWKPDELGWYAIHAGKNAENIEGAMKIDPFRSVLAQHGICRHADFPLGSVVAIGRVCTIHPTEGIRVAIGAEERAFGDYGDNRFAWEFDKVIPVRPAVETRGYQKIWNWQPEPELLKQLRKLAGVRQ